MAASDYVPIFFKNRLHLAGRPQMSTRPSQDSGVRYFIWQSDVLPARFMMALPPALIAKL